MSAELDRGSLWHRWDPHIHAPGTILSDHYPSTDGWEQFLSRIETSNPPVRALGVTDYYSTATYKAVRAHKEGGRLADVDLIFPNVELRLGVGTDSGSPVNVHLLVCPNDDDHVERLHDFLNNLRFEALGETYRCNPDQIRRLGRVHDHSAVDDVAALKVGTNQFKVSLDDLRSAIRSSQWAQNNILIAVAASRSDGTSGLQSDASLARLRREIEKTADIIFSGRPADRTFWLGQSPSMSKDDVIAQYGNIKPCLHGSDAHRPERVAAPDQDRRCWLKGALEFSSLAQACLEPEIRVFVGSAVPSSAPPSQTITEVRVSDANFLAKPIVPLNPGLVGIIGARGSGKTALADFIAVGGEAFPPKTNKLSFINRASDRLAGARVDLDWADATTSGVAIDDLRNIEENPEPFVRYLSQQFVDRLCSAEGLTDELLGEIQRVIFQAHPTEDRLGATDFDELLDLKADAARTARAHYESELRELSEEALGEQEKAGSVGALRNQLKALKEAVEKSQGDRQALVNTSGGSQDRLEAYTTVATVLQARRSVREQIDRRKTALESLRSEVALTRTRTFPEGLRQLQTRHRDAQLSETLWSRFQHRFSGDVDQAIGDELGTVANSITSITGTAVPPPADATLTLLPAGADLAMQSVALLAAEAARLETLIGVDKQAARQLTALNSKIAADEGRAAGVARQIEVAEKAPARLAEIRAERRSAYGKVFEALIAEQSELTALYDPLSERISAETGSARQLAFAVRRNVDIGAWADRGEALIDLRKGSTLRRGSLADLARTLLLQAWATGSAEEVTTALAVFREQYDTAIIECCPYNRQNPDDQANFRQWVGDVSAWLYDTRHIEIAYGIQFDGTDVERLSPGTRGVVLLLLYLAIDLDDNRPLLIDQPEENLDPKSIFVELVDRLRVAKQRRQIIIVTHNANLVVNTDADQVIVASCGPHRPGELPEISYIAGGLEDPRIRARVCDILEGGEQAFKERAKRLRVRV